MTLLLNSLINNSLIKDGLTGDSLIVNTISFIPTDIENAKVWLTYLDSDTVIRDVSDVVSQWDDKSGNDNHATATASLSPTYIEGEGIDFDGITNAMLVGSAGDWNFLHDGTGATVFIAYETNVANPDARYGLLGTVGSPGFQISMEDRSSYGVSNGLYTQIRNASADVIEKYNYPDVCPQQTTNIVSVRYGTEVGVSNDFYSYSNGVELGTLDNSNTPSTADSALMYIGYTVGGKYLNGKIKEIIIYDRKLTIEEHAQVIEYLKTQHTV